MQKTIMQKSMQKIILQKITLELIDELKVLYAMGKVFDQHGGIQCHQELEALFPKLLAALGNDLKQFLGLDQKVTVRGLILPNILIQFETCSGRECHLAILDVLDEASYHEELTGPPTCYYLGKHFGSRYYQQI